MSSLEGGMPTPQEVDEADAWLQKFDPEHGAESDPDAMDVADIREPGDIEGLDLERDTGSGLVRLADRE